MLNLSAEQVSANPIAPTACLLIIASAYIFLLLVRLIRHLSFASLGGVKPKWDLWAVPLKAGEAGFSYFFFLARGTLSRREVPSWD